MKIKSKKLSKPFIVFIAVVLLGVMITGGVYLFRYLRGDFLIYGGEGHMQTFEGKIIQINDDNTIVVEITAERDSDILKLGENLTVKYNIIDVTEIDENNQEKKYHR